MEIEVFRNLQNKYGNLTFANTEQKCIKYDFRKEFGICGKKPYLENECQILR